MAREAIRVADMNMQMGQYAVAARCYQAAIEAGEDDWRVYESLGRALRGIPAHRASISAFSKALATGPFSTRSLNNLAAAHASDGNLEAAAFFYLKSLDLDSEQPLANFEYGMVLLAKSNFREGWQHYEYRMKLPTEDGSLIAEAAKRGPLLGAERLWGKTLLVVEEQGLGDTLQFCRFLLRAVNEHPRIVFRCSDRIAPLLAGMCPISRESEPWPAFDHWCGLMSLPWQLDISDESLLPCGAYLAAAPRPDWRMMFDAGPAKPPLNVGIAWQGSKGYGEDYGRSIPIHHYKPLQMPRVRLYSLHNDIAPHLDDVHNPLYGLDRHYAFSDTAPFMQSLDLVITSDTSLAHLAGALGVPCWVALRRNPEWRWMRDRADSPWYPSMRLFRQEVDGEWGHVFADMAACLRDLAAR